MAVYTSINDPSAYFQVALWTGDGNSTQAITNDGNSNLQPDFVWLKRRNGVENHTLADTSRGVTKRINSNEANAEDTNGIASVQSDGFTVSLSYNGNANGSTYVGWQWKANGGSRTTFSESGSNPGGGYQVNTTAGFSIIDYSGTSGAGTVQHGLGAVPHLILVKRRDSSDSWRVYHKDLGLNGSYPNFLQLDQNAASSSGDSGNFAAAPSSTVFSVGNYSVVNTNNASYIAYAFTEKQGFSRFGTYEGNGNTDGPFVYTGFKPAWLVIKRIDDTNNWYIFDNTRDSYQNPFADIMEANSNIVENADTGRGDFLSNGVKIRSTANAFNNSSGTYIYMAFAESPFVSSAGVPTTAK